MKINISACLLLSSIVFSAHSMIFKNEVPVFGDTKIFLEGEDVKDFMMTDINDDGNVDLLWKTSEGDINYQLQADNQTSSAFSDESKFFPTETMVSGENIKTFGVEDVNKDGRLDIIWKDDAGTLKYKVQTKKTMLAKNYERLYDEIEQNYAYRALQNTTWKVTYADSRYGYKTSIMSFPRFNQADIDRGFAAAYMNRVFHASAPSRVPLGLSFSSRQHMVLSYGCRLTGQTCRTKYIIHEVSLDKMSGIVTYMNTILRPPQRASEAWTATKITE